MLPFWKGVLLPFKIAIAIAVTIGTTDLLEHEIVSLNATWIISIFQVTPSSERLTLKKF